MIVIKAHYDSKVIMPDEPVDLPKGVPFILEIRELSESEMSSRTPGLLRGQVWMSEDFNDPLPDEFWFGEDEKS